MRAYLVDPKHSGFDNRPVRFIDSVMFHGDAERLKLKHTRAPCFLGYGEWSPLHIFNNIFNIAPVFMPSGNMVINKSMLQNLVSIDCEIKPVVFHKVCNLDPAIKLSSYNRIYSNMQEYFSDNPRDEISSSGLNENYFEVLPRNAYVEKNKYSSREITIIKTKDIQGVRNELVVYPGMVNK